MEGLHVAHVVVTQNFAGVERYLTYVTPALATAGLRITVIGGDPLRMHAELRGSRVAHLPAATLRSSSAALRAVRPDVVHAHMTAAETAAVVSSPLRVPIVATRHFATRRGSTFVGRCASCLISRRVRCQIAISAFVASGIESDSIVIPNAVPDAQPGGHDQPTVLVAQRLEAEKETIVAVQAWARSALRRQGWRIVLAGRGAEERTLRSVVDDLGISESVAFAGFVEDLASLMASSAALLATAPAEPFGLSVVEAMARATPVLAAAGGAHLETLAPVSEDWLFPPGDVAACAAVLDRLAAEPSAATEYGHALRHRQQTTYSLSAHTDSLLAVYTGLALGA